MPKQLSDAILLERFVTRREEAAFVTLVERHGPLVEGVCRRVLRDHQDVEDVCQATFLVLARKASRVSWRGSVGGWLRAVAYRLALHARADRGRRRLRESLTSALVRSIPRRGNAERLLFELPEQYHPLVDPFVELESRDLRRLIEDELRQMPDKYRAPVVLCDLEGRTHEEAARKLGWPAGSMSRRLQRARMLLRQRLSDRGVSVGVMLVGICLAIYAIRSRSVQDDGRAAWEIRQAMVPFNPASAGGLGLESTLTDVVQGKRDLPHARLVALASKAAQVAGALQNHRPAKHPERWREWTVEMHESAAQLALAFRESDEPAILAAARRLNTSCVKCHEVFR